MLKGNALCVAHRTVQQIKNKLSNMGEGKATLRREHQ